MDEINPKFSPVENRENRIQRETRLLELSLAKTTQQQKTINAATTSMNEYSDNAEVEGDENPSKKMRGKRGQNDKKIPGAVGKSEGFVQDQILIAPEIMTKILEELDLRSLKICRQVCKSWLQQAQTHMEKRTIVRFVSIRGSAERIKAFKEMCQKKKLLQGLPQPFKGLDVDLNNLLGNLRGRPPYKLQLKQLELLCPPFVLTRFSPAYVPLEDALPLIIKCSSSMEYLRLEAGSWSSDCLPPMDPQQAFPQLKHVDTDVMICHRSTPAYNPHFSSIVAWIVKASPRFEMWQSWTRNNVEVGSDLVLKVDIQQVKTLHLTGAKLNSEASEHFMSIPFSRLEHLKFDKISSELGFGWSSLAALTTVKKSVNTLKSLNFPTAESIGIIGLLANSEFPVCPNLEELTLSELRGWGCNISNIFPALRVLNISYVDVHLLGDSWRDLPPFQGVKTLRAKCYGHNTGNGDLFIKFLEKFPELERLGLNASTLMNCCRLKATGNLKYSRIFQGVKYLEVKSNRASQLTQSLVGFVTGFETTAAPFLFGDTAWTPFGNMPSLKVIEFQWVDGFDLEHLLEVAAAVEKLVVTNCCSVPRVGDEKSKDRLNELFESASNVECGCENSDK